MNQCICLGHNKYCPYCFGKGFVKDINQPHDAMDLAVDLNETKPVKLHPLFQEIFDQHFKVMP